MLVCGLNFGNAEITKSMVRNANGVIVLMDKNRAEKDLPKKSIDKYKVYLC